MKKLDLAQTLQLVGNAGVIIGILLLVYELAQNREMMQAQTRNAIAEHLSSSILLQSLTPEYLTMSTKRAAGETLTPEEERMYLLGEIAFWRSRENIYYQHQRGLFEDSEYLGLREVWVRILNSDEKARTIWCEMRGQQSQGFNDELEKLMPTPCE